jgi:thioredoxin-like negative regulator of GroEL
MLIHTPYIALSEANFQAEVLRAELVLVDCWASWCQPMHSLKPAYSKLSIASVTPIKFGHLNIAVSTQLAARHRVRVVPTLLIFQHGDVVDRIIGSITNQELTQKINQLLSGRSINRSQFACL